MKRKRFKLFDNFTFNPFSLRLILQLVGYCDSTTYFATAVLCSLNCAENALCVESNGSSVCVCKDGFIGNADVLCQCKYCVRFES